jgi:hypothetical protein
MDLSAALLQCNCNNQRTAINKLQQLHHHQQLNWTVPTDVTDVVGYNVYNGDELEYATTSTETNYKWTYFSTS